jgi:hypothetical protein
VEAGDIEFSSRLISAKSNFKQFGGGKICQRRTRVWKGKVENDKGDCEVGVINA